MGPSSPFRSLAASLALSLALATPAAAAPLASPAPIQPSSLAVIDDAIAEAADRFGLPSAWIRAVMQVESAGNPHAVSRAGAIGLMQVMPATFADLRAEFGLGADPFAIRNNILAGAAYLRAMYDRYGAPGFLAAYNGGPERWEAYREGAKPLPAETIAYLVRLAPRLGFPIDGRAMTGSFNAATSPYRSQIFVRLTHAPTTGSSTWDRQVIGATTTTEADHPEPAHALFAARSLAPSASNERPATSGLAMPESDSASPLAGRTIATVKANRSLLFVDATQAPISQ